MEQEVKIGKIEKDIEYIKLNIAEMNLKLDEKYVTHAEFAPVKKIVYGMVAIILIGFVTSIASLIYIKL